MQVEFFNQLCNSTFNFLKAAREAREKKDFNDEHAQLEEAYTDFVEAVHGRTVQQAANTVRSFAQDNKMFSYVTEQTMAMYTRIHNGEQPSLPPLTGENGMLSVKVDPIEINLSSLI